MTGEAIAKPGSRVPYLKGNFKVEGLPPGIVFKKPFCYGAQQCKAIMEAAGDILFVIQTEEAGGEIAAECIPPVSVSSVHSITIENMVKSSLRKVASEANIGEIMSGNRRLTEEDIDVVDLLFTQDERLTLYTYCRDFFDADAWAAFGHNAKDTSNSATDLIFPLYTEAADEDFWLFYCPAQTLSSIENARANTKLRGHWLDRKDIGGTYTVLTANDEIKVKWIIKTDHGPLFYEKSLNVDANGDGFDIPLLFKNCIRVTLQRSGFLKE